MTTQPAFTSSKLTIETLEQDVKYVNNKNARITPGVVLMSLLLTLLTMSLCFTSCSSVSIVKFEHVIVGWVHGSYPCSIWFLKEPLKICVLLH